MKSLLSIKPGGPQTLVLQDVEMPQAGPGEVIVKISIVSINYPDVLIIQDLYQFKPERPFAPGSECAGTVHAVGEGVTDFAPGDRVCALTGHGALSEYVKIPAVNLFAIPDGVSDEAAASLLMTYATGYHGLFHRGGLEEGDNLLVLGASGGVGVAAIELGKAAGARVIAAVSSKEKGDFAQAAGADEIVIYEHAPFDKAQSKALATQFKEAIGPAGAHVIYDAVGGDYSEAALRSIAWEGRFLVIGFPAGIAKLPLNLTLLKSCDVRGVFYGAFAVRDAAGNRTMIEELFQMLLKGQIRPRISERFSFAKGGDAIAKMASRGALGKLIVTVNEN